MYLVSGKDEKQINMEFFSVSFKRNIFVWIQQFVLERSKDQEYLKEKKNVTE